MKLPEKKKLKTKKNPPAAPVALHGVAKWIKEYRDRFCVDPEQLEQTSRKYLAETESLAKNHSADGEQTDEENGDDEGWTVVSRSLKKTRQRMVASTEKTLNRLRAKHKRASQRKELTNFYKFQMTDKKADQLSQLKMKFELDKQRILQMRQQRKFKPF